MFAIGCSGETPIAEPPASAARVDVVGAPTSALTSIGDTVRLTAAVQDQQGRALSSAGVEWSSASTGVAIVSSGGLLTAIGNGTTTITARVGAVTGRADVTVRQAVASIRLNADTVKVVSLTDTVRLRMIAADARGAVVSDASGVSWATADSTVASVSTTGLITALNNGTTTISAQSGSYTAKATVQVQQVPARIQVAQRIVVLSTIGSVARLTATLTDARDQATAGSPTWSTSNGGVLSVSADGLVTARALGTGAVIARAGSVVDTVVIRIGDPVRLVLKQEKVHEFIDATQMPSYVYAGVTYPGGPVSYFPQGFRVFDLWQDGHPDFFVPLNKAYGSGIDTRVQPFFFKNVGGTFVNGTDEVNLPAIAGVRRVAELGLANDPFRGLFGVAHDTHDGRLADGVLVAAGASPRNATASLDPFPLSAAVGRPTAVNAHAMAGGDLNGDGRTDFAVGDWGDFSGRCNSCQPFFLLQTTNGRWTVRPDAVLADVTLRQPLVNPGAGEGHNLLIDLHLADVNGDRLADLIAGYGHGSSFSIVYFNQGDAKFSRAASVALPPPPFGIDNSLHLRTYSPDLNGDGALDLVILYSRYVPYYGGYALQILINNGKGTFSDETASRLRSLADREAPVERLTWSDNFQFIDVSGDGHVDLVGSHSGVVRLWLNNGAGVFTEIPVTVEAYNNFPRPLGWVDLGGGRFGTLAMRSSWTDAKGSATRVWFSIYEFDRVIR